MPVLHQTSTLNVEASVSRHFKDILPTITRPSYLTTMPAIIENMPETPISPPCFSFVHIPAGSRMMWMGNRVSDSERGVKALAIFEVSAWVSRSNNRTWNAQLRKMSDMIHYIYTISNAGIIVRDYESSPSNPVQTPFLVRLLDIDWVATAPDINPDYERRRALINYMWTARSY